MAPPPPRELMDDVVGDIFVRIPPDDPAQLLRASLVCKAWRRVLTDPVFRRRYREIHGKPPVLGFVCHTFQTPRFVPTSTFRPHYPERRRRRVLDCRHGRVLFFDDINSRSGYGRLLVWDPIAGEDQQIPRNMKVVPNNNCNGAILCAAADCDHLGCHGGPFVVVFVSTNNHGECIACAYSSDAGGWTSPSTVHQHLLLNRGAVSPVLTRDKIYFACNYGRWILRYDLQNNGDLSLFNGPWSYMNSCIALIPAEDGGLRFAGIKRYELSLWSLEMMGPFGVAAWTQHCIIELSPLVTMTNTRSAPRLIGVTNGPVGDVVFVSMGADVFTVEVESQKMKKVDDIDFHTDFSGGDELIFPYTGFVTP